MFFHIQYYSDLLMSEVNLDEQIEEWGWKREDFLTFFSHPEWGDPRKGTHILLNDSYWSVRTVYLAYIKYPQNGCRLVAGLIY